MKNPWEVMDEGYGDWVRDGTMAVARRDLGWSMLEVDQAVGGVGYAVPAQGIRLLWKQA